MNYPNEELRAILRLEQQYCETVEDLASTWMMNEGCQPRQRGTINSVTITVYSILATLLLDFLEASAIPTFSRSNTAAVHVFSTEPSPDFGVFVLSSSVAAGWLSLGRYTPRDALQLTHAFPRGSRFHGPFILDKGIVYIAGSATAGYECHIRTMA
ncbi:hypothetical protein FOXG_16438 [Fusarium oxysporum f. sp. lycopersici 4287]|uniref:Uncharacterized protein n=2 Tax=Fusarium oxysporum TaxID=5507 RepID=A0A0J9W9L9_FUSO4|nr:hypothetical protein FOXG_16438 [Fusarium oxysporum f. sp. lycopersici 4287]KNB19310.1 hypothetical protein FOXG_16438 [Fusarium oxysporum f. sp. lycopersici 4287]